MDQLPLTLRILCSRLPWEWADRKWYWLSGVLLERIYGDDGRWGDYDMDRNPPPAPDRLCAHCGDVVELPGDHLQINRDYFHTAEPCVSAATSDNPEMAVWLDKAKAMVRAT
jgi:hypothetical protein